MRARQMLNVRRRQGRALLHVVLDALKRLVRLALGLHRRIARQLLLLAQFRVVMDDAADGSPFGRAPARASRVCPETSRSNNRRGPHHAGRLVRHLQALLDRLHRGGLRRLRLTRPASALSMRLLHAS